MQKLYSYVFFYTILCFVECTAPPKNLSTIKNYLCLKCEILVKKDTIPSYSACPKGGNHNWKDLGFYGDNQFLCKKCSLLLKSKSMPNCAGCPKGGNHEWKKL